MVKTEAVRETIEMKVQDIKIGDILEIWYSDKENKTIERIVVRMPIKNKY